MRITRIALCIFLFAAFSNSPASSQEFAIIQVSSGDGSVTSGVAGPGYAASHSASIGSLVNNSTIQVGQAFQFDSGGPYYQIWRGFLPFDTSPLPDDATITKAELYIRLSLKIGFCPFSNSLDEGIMRA
jgi:hypothetical protein